MSGHSKWNNIKRKKEATDGAKAKIFTKIGREIAVCVKEGGGDPNNNSKLRDLIAKAKSNNVPNDNIDRIIKNVSITPKTLLQDLVVYFPNAEQKDIKRLLKLSASFIKEHKKYIP